MTFLHNNFQSLSQILPAWNYTEICTNNYTCANIKVLFAKISLKLNKVVCLNLLKVQEVHFGFMNVNLL